MSTISHYNPSRLPVHAEIVPLACSTVCLLLVFLWPDFGYVATLASDDGTWGLAGTSVLISVTGQFAHIDPAHLFLNLIGLWLVCWGLKPWRTLMRDLAFMGAGLAGVALGLLCSPEVSWYRGLSGCLHGFFCGYTSLVMLSDQRWRVRTVAAVLLLGAAIKMLLEDPALATHLFALPLPDPLAAALHYDKNPATAGFGETAGTVRPVLYAAHRWGALAGLLAGLPVGLAARLTAKRTE